MKSDEVSVFKAKPISHILYIAAIAMIVLCVSYVLNQKEFGIATLVVITILIGYYVLNLINERISSIEVDHKENVIVITQIKLNKKKKHRYALHEIKGHFVKKIGARGAKLNVFRLIINDEQTFDLLPNYHGFTQKQLEELSKTLENSF